MASRRKTRMQWYRVDLHIHTMASHDYLDMDAGYIDILRKAEQQGIDILAFTDHNTVNGYASMMREIEQLEYLEQLGRAQKTEVQVLAEYRRLLDKILVLPGFEFTATFGFHIIGIFSPDKSVREIEHVLLGLNIPVAVLDEGNSVVGASSDVLTAYRAINAAGGICIAAHVNAAHGVAMKGMDFGGQTRIAYTQDVNLHALEATDLGRRGRNTARFFDGTKSEYPRKMRCIQGSDAHSLHSQRDDKGRVLRWGVGERATEMMLPEQSFAALLDMLQSNDFSRSRIYAPDHKPQDYIQSAREEGPTVVQAFHESIERKGGRLYSIISDVCAFANTNGGTVYVGVNADARKKVAGIQPPQEAIATIHSEINSLITPPLNVEIDTLETQGQTVIRIQVPYGKERPYAIDNTKVYVRDEADTSLAIRDEIVELVRQGVQFQEYDDATPAVSLSPAIGMVAEAAGTTTPPAEEKPPDPEPARDDRSDAPQAGVEIVGVETRGDTRYYIMRDLRNGNVVRNVTESSARRLWHYAIKQRESNPVREDKVDWRGDYGLWRVYRKAGTTRYDLVQRENGNVRVYYGVTENGMHGPWGQFLDPDDEG